VALVQGHSRYQNVAAALECIAPDIDLAGVERLLLKPNLVMTHRPLAATHVDAVRAILDFVRARYDGPITIAEGPAFQHAAEAFAHYGYGPLAAAYDARLLDLNEDEPVPVEVCDWRLRPLRLHLARTVVESDYRISVGPPKTHDTVIATLSIKNMVMGSLISRHATAQGQRSRRPNLGGLQKRLWGLVPTWVQRLPPAEWLQFRVMSELEPSDKMRMHQSYPVINLNLALLASRVMPHLAVIDGFEGMEGNGPTEGTAVPLRLALASTDALAVDLAGAHLMGFDSVGYLRHCGQLGLGTRDLAAIELVGNAELASCRRPFRPHDTHSRQRRWQMPGVEKVLRRGK
jgi:uncharacterized protein (DUF362 family)